MKQALSALGVGFLFSIGLGMSGMTRPEKVIGFLDWTYWDPTLIFVMIGAIAVHATFYPLIMKRKRPFFSETFHMPQKKEITPALITGSLLFGVGWGLAGFCPGPAITSLAIGQSSVVVFVIMMIFGMLTFRWIDSYFHFNR